MPNLKDRSRIFPYLESLDLRQIFAVQAGIHIRLLE